jgi:hypothetical protein
MHRFEIGDKLEEIVLLPVQISQSCDVLNTSLRLIAFLNHVMSYTPVISMTIQVSKIYDVLNVIYPCKSNETPT